MMARERDHEMSKTLKFAQSNVDLDIMRSQLNIS